MVMKKKYQVKRLSTSDASHGLSVRKDNGKIMEYPVTEEDHNQAEYQELYFLSDERPKEGDWFYDEELKRVTKCNKGAEALFKNSLKPCPKVVATTDEELIKDGVAEIDKDFIKLYAEKGGIDYVYLEYEHILPEPSGSIISNDNPMVKNNTKLKLNPDNTVVWSLVEYWIDVDKERPKSQMKVKFKYVDGIEDCGWFNGKEFTTLDPRSNTEIQFWKPFETEIPLKEAKEKMYSKEEVIERLRGKIYAILIGHNVNGISIPNKIRKSIEDKIIDAIIENLK